MPIATHIPVPTSAHPPVALIPLPGAAVASVEVRGYLVCVSWLPGAPAARPDHAEAVGHVYAVDVMVASAAEDRVWRALAQAALAGLCFRCSSSEQVESLIGLHAEGEVLRMAHRLVWAHAPVLGLSCPACDELEA